MNFKDSKPIYLQIADKICDEILSDKYHESERIPSAREYASLVEVNPNTIVRTFEYLQTNEIIFNKRGMGYFVNVSAKETIIKMRKQNFIDESLPDLFREMDLLGIDIDEIIALYNNR